MGGSRPGECSPGHCYSRKHHTCYREQRQFEWAFLLKRPSKPSHYPHVAQLQCPRPLRQLQTLHRWLAKSRQLGHLGFHPAPELSLKFPVLSPSGSSSRPVRRELYEQISTLRRPITRAGVWARTYRLGHYYHPKLPSSSGRKGAARARLLAQSRAAAGSPRRTRI